MGERGTLITMMVGMMAVFALACAYQTYAGPELSPTEKIAQVCKRHFAGVDEQQCEAKLRTELAVKQAIENHREAGLDDDQLAREAGVR